MYFWLTTHHLLTIGHVLNEQGTGYEHIFSWYEHSISIELKMGHVIWKSIKKLVNSPNLMVIGLNAKARHTFKIRELSMDWRTPVPPIHTKVYHAFGFKPITVKFGESTNFWMLFQMTCPIFQFNRYWMFVPRRKYVRTQSPARLEHGKWI